MGDDTKFVLVRGPRGNERSVCVYTGVPVPELQNLLASIFKTGSRQVVGLEDISTSTCIALNLAAKSPKLLVGECYTLMLEEGAEPLRELRSTRAKHGAPLSHRAAAQHAQHAARLARTHART